MNHGRVSQALFIYKTATRHFIARTLKTQNGGAGDWFADLVLPNLPKPIAERLKDRVREAAEDGSIASRGGQDDEGPERFLEERHFPHIVKRNWDAFRHSLKERDVVLKQLRHIKGFRDDKVAHNSEPLSNEEVTEIVETCRSIVEKFDSAAAGQLTKLLTPPEVKDEAAVERSTGQEAEPAASVSEQETAEGNDDVWREVNRFERERTRKQTRLHRLMRQFADLSEAYESIGELTYQVDKLRPVVELEIAQDQLEEAQSDLYSLLWLETAPKLLAELMPTASAVDWENEQPFYGDLEIQHEHGGIEIQVKLSLVVRKI